MNVARAPGAPQTPRMVGVPMSSVLREPRQRIEVDAGEPRVSLPSEVLHEVCAHALEAQPEECCGLVLGTSERPFARVVRCRNEMTAKHRAEPEVFPRDGHSAYYMNELDYLQAQRQAEEQGELVSAIYHSHVGAGPYLSEMDQEYAEHPLFPFPEAAQIVLAVWDRKVAGGGIFVRDVDQRFRGASLELLHI